MEKVTMLGYISNVAMKIGQSSDLVKELKLEVHGDMSSLQALMKEPLQITFEPMQAKFGEQPPVRHGRKTKKEA